ncbi:MAG: hypothetical protein V1742_03330, partial [Pseudomonadota bacterium]
LLGILLAFKDIGNILITLRIILTFFGIISIALVLLSQKSIADARDKIRKIWNYDKLFTFAFDRKMLSYPELSKCKKNLFSHIPFLKKIKTGEDLYCHWLHHCSFPIMYILMIVGIIFLFWFLNIGLAHDKPSKYIRPPKYIICVEIERAGINPAPTKSSALHVGARVSLTLNKFSSLHVGAGFIPARYQIFSPLPKGLSQPKKITARPVNLGPSILFSLNAQEAGHEQMAERG